MFKVTRLFIHTILYVISDVFGASDQNFLGTQLRGRQIINNQKIMGNIPNRYHLLLRTDYVLCLLSILELNCTVSSVSYTYKYVYGYLNFQFKNR